MNPALAAKAARLTVVARRDGSYHVAGDSGTHAVRLSPYTGRLYCDCQAAASRSCSHLYAVRWFIDRSTQKAG